MTREAWKACQNELFLRITSRSQHKEAMEMDVQNMLPIHSMEDLGNNSVCKWQACCYWLKAKRSSQGIHTKVQVSSLSPQMQRESSPTD